MKFHKKGMELGDMPMLAIMLVVLVTVISIGASVLVQTQASQCSGTYDTTTQQCYTNVSKVAFQHSSAWNATQDGISGIGTFGDNVPTIAIVIVGALVIGILTTAFVVTRGS